MGKLVLNPGQTPHHSLSGLDVILARDGNLFHGLAKSKLILHHLSPKPYSAPETNAPEGRAGG